MGTPSWELVGCNIDSYTKARSWQREESQVYVGEQGISGTEGVLLATLEAASTGRPREKFRDCGGLQRLKPLSPEEEEH